MRLLAEGHTDEFVAHQMGWTRRTLQRRLKVVLDKLGAISRFQAGVLSERRSWISVEPGSDPESAAHSASSSSRNREPVDRTT